MSETRRKYDGEFREGPSESSGRRASRSPEEGLDEGEQGRQNAESPACGSCRATPLAGHREKARASARRAPRRTNSWSPTMSSVGLPMLPIAASDQPTNSDTTGPIASM